MQLLFLPTHAHHARYEMIPMTGKTSRSKSGRNVFRASKTQKSVSQSLSSHSDCNANPRAFERPRTRNPKAMLATAKTKFLEVGHFRRSVNERMIGMARVARGWQ